MEIRLLRQLFKEGMLLSATIAPAPMQPDSWLMVFDKPSGEQECITKARTSIDKYYKRINGAIADAELIGFQDVRIKLK